MTPAIEDVLLEELLLNGSITALRQAFLDRHLSVAEAVAFYVARVEALDRSGPTLNSIRALAPDLAAQAQRADAAIADGRALGPLHGIPVLLKDNIAAAGQVMAAGAAALAGFKAQRDATLVTRLRKAGAIIFGKANMTEFADYVSDVMPSGFSGACGVVKNPHGFEYGRGLGSSIGPAAAVAAGLVPVAIGSETQNSIQTPASVSSLVGFKPSVGLVSRSGVVPLVTSQDSPGPLARSVEDAALVMTVIAGADIRDTASLEMALAPPREAVARDLRSIRIGVPRRTIADRADIASLLPSFEQMLSRLASAGVTIVDRCDVPSAEQLLDVRSSVFRTEFKAALNAFLAENGSPCGMSSLGDIIRWNSAHPDKIPYGQSLLEAAEATSSLDDPQYRSDRLRDIALSRTAGIDAALQFANADALIVPMGTAAKWTGKAGAPVLALPIGLDDAGRPFGVTLFSSYGQDQRLLDVGAALAPIMGARCLPAL
jgi:amidase